jgi:hypothetical protein
MSQAADPDPDRVGRMQDQMVSRRTVMKAAGAGAATIATGGLAAAQEGDGTFNRTSEYAPQLRSEDTVTFAAHDRSEADSPFYFIDDSGEEDSLTNYGAMIKPRDDADEDVDGPKPHNPISLSADNIDTDAYHVFPRGVTKENADGDEVDVSALQAEEWSVTTNASVSDKQSGANGPGVEISVADGSTSESATFENFDPIDSGVARRRIFAVANVSGVETGATVELRVVDGQGRNKAVELTAGDAQVIQERVGDLASSGSDFANIEKVVLNVASGGATVHFVGLDVERESEIVFGEKEQFKTADEDEIETVEVSTPSGSYSITELASMGSVFSNAMIHELDVDTQINIDELPLSHIDVEYDAEAAEPYSQDYVETLVVNFELPNPFDVTWTDPNLMDTVVLPSDRYQEVRTTTDGDMVTIAEIESDDTSYSWTDRTSRYNETMDTDVTVETSLTPGDYNGVEFTRLVRSSEQSDLMSGSASVGGPVDTRGGGGIWGMIMSPLGAFASALGLVGIAKYVSSRFGA